MPKTIKHKADIHQEITDAVVESLEAIREQWGLLMTDQEICKLFDTNINMTMKELSVVTGKSIRELKDILLKPNN